MGINSLTWEKIWDKSNSKGGTIVVKPCSFTDCWWYEVEAEGDMLVQGGNG